MVSRARRVCRDKRARTVIKHPLRWRRRGELKAGVRRGANEKGQRAAAVQGAGATDISQRTGSRAAVSFQCRSQTTPRRVGFVKFPGIRTHRMPIVSTGRIPRTAMHHAMDRKFQRRVLANDVVAENGKSFFANGHPANDCCRNRPAADKLSRPVCLGCF